MKRYRKEIVPKKKEEQAGEGNKGERIIKWASAFIFLLAALAIMRGVMLRLPGSITVSSSVNGRLLPISSVETEKKQVALTFDAVDGNEDTEIILETLKKHDVHATFFMTGGWVEAYPDDVKALLNAGHDLGNGSESHRSMPQLTGEQCMDEIQQVHTKVQELTGYDMFLFRPPYGDYDNQVVSSAAKCGYYSILWDVDSLDWKDYGTESILNNVLKSKNLQNGSIIRCHSGAKYTSQALEKLIDGLEKQGYEIVPVSQLIYKEKYHLNGEGRQMG
ncbi:MAG: polysaccharide deacetylase family protein, partial [Kineothrix sp.]|nr:polysaccharide deacetylase family protein [Kineothrix sp.]